MAAVAAPRDDGADADHPPHAAFGEDPELLCEAIGTALGGQPLGELARRAEALLAGELRRHGDWSEAPAVDVCERTERLRVRLAARTRRSDVLAGALYAAGARWVTVRSYPSPEALEAWSDFGKEGFVLPAEVAVEAGGGIGPTPRLAVPLLAAGIVGLCLNRLGLIGWFGALLLSLLVAVLVLALWHASKRARIEWVRFLAVGAAGDAPPTPTAGPAG